MNITKTFALVSYSKAVLENYNPVVVKESNDIDLLEALDANDSPTEGFTIVEQTASGLEDYYTGEPFKMPTY